MPTHIFGIRHHGPGSARHTLEALTALRPDIILIEGPPEGEALIAWAAHADMRPPVALLAYEPQSPQNAVFYPFAVYSPEWQAIRYALQHGVPLRFIDMPLAHKLARTPEEESSTEAETKRKTRDNPIRHLAEIAGYDDPEEWWDQHFEQTPHPSAIFNAVNDAMRALRAAFPDEDLTEKRREAFMRRALRAARAQMFDTIAVVCGAWHAPAFDEIEANEKTDDALLKKLPKVAIETAWIPWTNERMTFESGYGAGITSPGWYEHNWAYPQDDGAQWLAMTAQAFREAQKDVSSAHVIETLRLARALADLRGLPKIGLYELREATQTVMCMGDPTPLALIKERLIVGKRIGETPTGVPRSPLQKDFEDQLRALRLDIDAGAQNIELDLRKPNHLERSHFLHRLHLLDVDWGAVNAGGGKGTFKETWALYWRPEMMIALIEKANWGNTVEIAANRYVERLAEMAGNLKAVVGLLHRAMQAELAQGVALLVQKMDALAADTKDATALLEAFPPLADLYQYGNVRNTDRTMVGNILYAVFYRLTAGLPPACAGLDEKQARSLAESVRDAHAAIRLLETEDITMAWINVLSGIAAGERNAPFLRGTCYKLLYDSRALTQEQMERQFSKALSLGVAPADAAQWMEGFLNEAAGILLIDEQIWRLVHNWITGIEDDAFIQMLPLIRRTFSAYTSVEKRKIAEKAAARQGEEPALRRADEPIDLERARRVLPILEKLLLPTPQTEKA